MESSPQTIESFIENYLLTGGFPMTDSNREKAREELACHPDLAGSSAEDRIALLAQEMWFGHH